MGSIEVKRLRNQHHTFLFLEETSSGLTGYWLPRRAAGDQRDGHIPSL